MLIYRWALVGIIAIKLCCVVPVCVSVMLMLVSCTGRFNVSDIYGKISFFKNNIILLWLCLRGGGGPQVGEITRFDQVYVIDGESSLIWTRSLQCRRILGGRNLVVILL